jgi:hypothetical protein
MVIGYFNLLWRRYSRSGDIHTLGARISSQAENIHRKELLGHICI